ncbi:siderophore synthetase component [Bacillus ectoiniformans]|uniref:IucA/IucC family protein n=1 Tax=Bacillus ectoiniformans TaxID=1494429 RepID=UPI001EF75FE6|nr:IucA/IucC family siderophore biosynthesis protein [Bacillus ectoiniformans]MBM7649156.1 siderophore synthetase component [Bacillus ectoiniformans]
MESLSLKSLQESNWNKADQSLTVKMLQEFMYEDIIQPVLIEEQEGVSFYEWKNNSGTIYRFQAKARMFDSYYVIPESLEVLNDEANLPHSISMLLSIQMEGKMTGTTAGHLIKEYLHTMVADTHIDEASKRSEDLIKLDYAELEGEMTGHPWITYNKGRIGFSYDDYLQYAPEQQQEIQLSWIAVHKEVATFHSIEGLNYEAVLGQELEAETKELFINKLRESGVDPEQYYFMPIHEWQWKEMIVTLFATEIAKQKLIPLGKGKDHYLPQQSVRTFVNRSNKEKFHVKLPMSILNTLVYRGLPSERTVIAPDITRFIKNIAANDSFLKDECRIGLLGENATMNVDHPAFQKLKGAPYQYLETLGVVWRESIYKELNTDERAITLAALLHVDHEETPFVSELIKKSGVTAEQWMEKLTKAILPPLLHFLYQYGTVFSPHGQNAVLVLKDDQPERLIMKDFVDDVNISDQPLPELTALSDELKAVLRSEAPEGLTQFILTGLFICHFRYLSNILEEKEQLPEDRFWEIVREEILAYQKRFPQLEERFNTFDLLKPSITKLTLNRNRMFDYGYGDDDDRPHASEFGTVTNALYKPIHVPNL